MFPSLFNYLLSCKDTPIIPVSIVLIGYIIVFATSHSYYISAVVYSVSVVLSVTCRCCDSTPTDCVCRSVAEDEIGRRSRVKVHVALDAGHRTDITVLPYYPVDRVG